VQIGGGVRVGDAFQAIVGLNLVAIWGLWFCVEISQAGHCCLVRFEQERYAPTNRKRRRRSTWAGYNGRAEVRGVAAEQFLAFGRGRLNW